MPIFVVFVSAGVLFDDVFFLWVSLNVKKVSTGTNGRIVIMEAHFDDEKYVLINLGNSNTEVEEIKPFVSSIGS